MVRTVSRSDPNWDGGWKLGPGLGSAHHDLPLMMLRASAALCLILRSQRVASDWIRGEHREAQAWPGEFLPSAVLKRSSHATRASPHNRLQGCGPAERAILYLLLLQLLGGEKHRS
jgi:hypothetical protein